MRVCMVAYAFYEEDTRMLQYANALAERGDQVDVIALRRERAPALEVLDGVTVYRLRTRRVNEQNQLAHLLRILGFLFQAGLFLMRRHLAKPYQVIHVHSVPDFLVFIALVPKLLGAKVILDIHDILPEFYAAKFGAKQGSYLFRLLVITERLSAGFADHVIIANDLWRRRLLSRSVRANKCTTFINYPDARIFYPRPRCRADGKFVILYPGSLNRHQGLDVAIRAFACVAEQAPEAELHIYGEGPEKASLMELSQTLGLCDRVIFHGSMPTREIAEVMSQADLAVVPKRASSLFGNEAASTKIMEFMSLAVPVVASRTKIDTYYHDDSILKFFESENEVALAESILLLRHNPQLRDQLVDRALQFVERNAWAVKKHEYISLVDGLRKTAVGAEKANVALRGNIRASAMKPNSRPNNSDPLSS